MPLRQTSPLQTFLVREQRGPVYIVRMLNMLLFHLLEVLVALAGERGTIRLWDVKSGQCKLTQEGKTSATSPIVFLA